MRKLHCTGDASWALQSSWQDVDFKRPSFPPTQGSGQWFTFVAMQGAAHVALDIFGALAGFRWDRCHTVIFVIPGTVENIKQEKTTSHRVVIDSLWLDHIGPYWTILDRLFSASFSFSTPKQMATVAPDLHCHPHLAAADAGCSIWGILSTGTMSDARCWKSILFACRKKHFKKMLVEFESFESVEWESRSGKIPLAMEAQRQLLQVAADPAPQNPHVAPAWA